MQPSGVKVTRSFPLAVALYECLCPRSVGLFPIAISVRPHSFVVHGLSAFPVVGASGALRIPAATRIPPDFAKKTAFGSSKVRASAMAAAVAASGALTMARGATAPAVTAAASPDAVRSMALCARPERTGRLLGSSFLASGSSLSLRRNGFCTSSSSNRNVVKAMASVNGTGAAPGLSIDLTGKKAFIAGVADDQGYGWAIAKMLAYAGAEVLVGTWVPALNIFETSLRRGKFDESRKLPNGNLFEITKVYPLDAVYDTPEDVPEDVKTNKRYAGCTGWTVSEVAESVKRDFGSIDILVHSLANGPEVSKPLLDTSRKGYLAAISASSYSSVSLLKYFAPIMNPGSSAISLTYLASEKTIPGYGGGMSSAKAALESDTRVLAFEAGRKHNIRVNTISAGPLKSRAAKAIGFIERMIDYSKANSPMQRDLEAEDIGNAAAFLASPLASAITGTVFYVDNGLHTMGLALDSRSLAEAEAPAAEKAGVAA